MPTPSDAHRCSFCDSMTWAGEYHACGGTPTYSVPIPLYTIQKCPICEGRGLVPCGFYSGPLQTSTTPEQCQPCRGAGILKVHNFTGAVERTV